MDSTKKKKPAAKKENSTPKPPAEKTRKTSRESEITKKKAAIEQLETELKEKKTQSNSLGSDAMAIMQKAKINNEIKALEVQIENLKIEISELEDFDKPEE